MSFFKYVILNMAYIGQFVVSNYVELGACSPCYELSKKYTHGFWRVCRCLPFCFIFI